MDNTPNFKQYAFNVNLCNDNKTKRTHIIHVFNHMKIYFSAFNVNLCNDNKTKRTHIIHVFNHMKIYFS